MFENVIASKVSYGSFVLHAMSAMCSVEILGRENSLNNHFRDVVIVIVLSSHVIFSSHT